MNLFLTEDGVVKLGYYGLTTLSECYSLEIMDCDGFRRFAPEVTKGQYEVRSDLWYLGVALVEMMGVSPCVERRLSRLPCFPAFVELPFDKMQLNHQIWLISFIIVLL